VKDKPSEEFEKFDKVMDKIMSVSKAELDRTACSREES